MSKRITTKDIKKWLDEFNNTYLGINMGYTASTGYVAIGRIGEHGSFSTVVSGSTAGQCWECFRAWEAGMRFGMLHRDRILKEGADDYMERY